MVVDCGGNGNCGPLVVTAGLSLVCSQDITAEEVREAVALALGEPSVPGRYWEDREIAVAAGLFQVKITVLQFDRNKDKHSLQPFLPNNPGFPGPDRPPRGHIVILNETDGGYAHFELCLQERQFISLARKVEGRIQFADLYDKLGKPQPEEPKSLLLPKSATL